MGFLDAFKAKIVQPAPEPVAAAVVADQRGPLDPRVHHEYFASDEAENGRFPWLARVYDATGTAHEMSGSEESHAEARKAAYAWCEATKDTMRGAV